MKQNFYFCKTKAVTSFIVSFLLLSSAALSQISFTSGAGLTQTQNFNGIGTVGNATLPTGWNVETGTPATYSATVPATGGTSGTGALTSLSGGNAYNFASGVNAATTDRAIGFISSGSFVSPRSIRASFVNNAGAAITSLAISFDYEKYRNGSRQFDWTFFYSGDGNTWTAVPAGNQTFFADANNNVINPSTSVNKAGISITGLNIANAGVFYLRWTYTGLGGSTNGQGLGIDNFSITAAVASGCTAPVQSPFNTIATTANSITLGWATPANNILIVRRIGSAPANPPLNGTVYSVGDITGTNDSVVYAGVGTSFVDSDLTPGIHYYYRSYAFDPTGFTASTPCYNGNSAATADTTTPVCNAAAQITGLNAGSITTNSVALGWNSPANQVMILARKGSAVTGVPVNGTAYSIGDVIGTLDTVIYVGSATGITAANLVPNTNYYFKAFAFDPTGTAANTACYNTTAAPAIGPITTQTCTGGAQITNLVASNIMGTSVDLTWTLPGSTNIIVLRYANTNLAIPAAAYPVSGHVYSVNDITGIDVSVAYIGTANSGTVTGLPVSSLAHFEAFAFDPAGYNGLPCYNLSFPPSVNITTSACNGSTQIGSVSATNPTSTTMDVSWTAPANQVIILRSAGVAVSNAPLQGTTYVPGSTIGGNTEVVYVGSGTGVNVTNLQPGVTYYYKAFSFDPTGFAGGTPCYNISNAPQTNLSTPACAPAQASGFTAPSSTATSVDLGVTIPPGANVVVMMRAGVTILGDFPQSGTTYTVGQTVGNNRVAYIGSSTSPVVNGLNPSTTYYFAAFAFNPTAYPGGTPCYNTTVSAPIVSRATAACATPTTAASNISFTNVGGNSFTIDWVKGNGGRNLVLLNTTNTFTTPVNGVDPVANSVYAGTGEQVVYNGDGNSVAITGLAANTTYYMSIYEVSCTGASVLFNVITPLAGNVTTITPLAIRLLSFTAFNKGSYNEISWKSLTENIGERYELEYSKDGHNFKMIALFNANGKASEYSYEDRYAASEGNYYRLRMVDASNVVSYSNIAAVRMGVNGFSLAAYPNPVQDELRVNLSRTATGAQIQLTDMSGRVIIRSLCTDGVNLINTSRLTPGIYLLHYTDQIQNKTIRITK